MHLLRAQDRIASRWKNGGGTTSEVAVFPPQAGLEDFGWRVSIAQVERGGPFSIFPGIDRKLALLEGRMTLMIDGQRVVDMSPASPPAVFPGDVATGAELTGGPVTDLNVMTRRGAFTADLAYLDAPPTISFEPAATTILLALSPAILHDGDNEIALSRLDALLAQPGTPRSFSVSADAMFYRIAIEAAGLR